MRQMRITPAKGLVLAGFIAAGTFIFTSKLMENRQTMPVKPLKTVEKTIPVKKEKEDLSPPVRTLVPEEERKAGAVAKQATAPSSFRKSTLKTARNYLISHGFGKDDVDSLLADSRVKKQDLRFPKAGTTKVKMTYERYKAYFKLDELAPKGVKFYLANKDYIEAKEAETGVPKALVLSHYGIESIYGDSTGHHLAIDVLLTRMETNPKRTGFALNELAALLRLCGKYGKDPLEVNGSDWAAIMPAQAIPTSLEAFDRRHPCNTFEELISARNSLAFMFDYLVRAGASNKSGFEPHSRNYNAAFAYNHSSLYARLAMEFAQMLEKKIFEAEAETFRMKGVSGF